MTNTKFLKKKMVESGIDDFVKGLSDILNISRSTASRKLNGKTDFTQSELSILAERLNISAEEIGVNFCKGCSDAKVYEYLGKGGK